MGETFPTGRPGADGTGEILYRALERRLEIEHPQRRILILGLDDRIATVGAGCEGVAAGDARDAGERSEQLGLAGIGDVVDVVPAATRPIELVLVGEGVVAHVHVMV